MQWWCDIVSRDLMAMFVAMTWLTTELRDTRMTSIDANGAALWWWFSFSGGDVQVAAITGRLFHDYKVT